jgi:hypothetical protein
MRKTSIATTVFLTLACSTVSLDAMAAVEIQDKKFPNCAALNAVYPGGVALSKNSKNRGGVTKRAPKVNAAVYKENKSKDRDKDGIACER